MSESLTDDLRVPQELIIEILLLLPVKSLLRFKCVSKQWLSLITSQKFCKSHLSSRSSKEKEYLNHQLLFTVKSQADNGLKQCSLNSALNEADPSTHVFDLESPNTRYPRSTEIVGIINGVVCLVIDTNHLFLWNPALKSYKYFTSSSDLSRDDGNSLNYCLAYDKSTDDYKVVSSQIYRPHNICRAMFHVYSLRTDSWRKIEGLMKSYLPMHDDNGMYANGKIYFAVKDIEFWPAEKKIVSLDIASEKFGEVQQPDYETGEYGLKLGVLGERPSVICYYKGTKADLWVKDNYGGVDQVSWCKVASILYDNALLPPPQSVYSLSHLINVFFCILSNGEIVLGHELGLLVYNSKHNEFRVIRLDDDVGSSSVFIAAPLSVESLVFEY